MTTPYDFGQSYFTRIQNRTKREYAVRYATWLATGSHGDPPERGALSCLRAHSVRLTLDAMFRDAKRQAELANARQWQPTHSDTLIGA